MYYKFKIVYMKNGVLTTYTEKRWYPFMDQAFDRFQHMCDRYKVGPYRYLCEWG